MCPSRPARQAVRSASLGKHRPRQTGNVSPFRVRLRDTWVLVRAKCAPSRAGKERRAAVSSGGSQRLASLPEDGGIPFLERASGQLSGGAHAKYVEDDPRPQRHDEGTQRSMPGRHVEYMVEPARLKTTS